MSPNAIVPAKAGPVDVAVVQERAEAMLVLWEIDLDTVAPDALRQHVAAAATALKTGQNASLAAALRRPATSRAIALAVDELVSAFAGHRKDVDLGASAKMLAEELAADSPTAIALRAGIRGLIRTSTFPPAIAEVLAAVKAQDVAWQTRAALLERLPHRAQEALLAIGRAAGGVPPAGGPGGGAPDAVAAGKAP